MSHSKGCSGQRELLLVLEGDLYLVPFPVLRPHTTDNSSEYLCERFSLLVIPSLTSLKLNQKLAKQALKNDRQNDQNNSNMSALVVGNPRLPACVTEQWGWGDLPYAQQEAEMVAEILQAKALIGSQVFEYPIKKIKVLFLFQASKEAVVCQIGEAECVHLATHVSWKLSAIVLAPGETVESQQTRARCFTTSPEQSPQDEDGSEVSEVRNLI